MSTTIFSDKNGGISSTRVTIGGPNNKVSLTSYMGSSKGGTTFKNKYLTTRVNNKGQAIGHGLTTGKHTTYYGRNFKPVSQMPNF